VRSLLLSPSVSRAHTFGRPLPAAVGIVRLVIHQAKELDHTKSLSGDLNPLARVYLNSSKSSAFSSPCFKHTNNPVWEAPYEFLCTDKETATVGVKVIDDRDFLKDPVVGYMTMRLTDLLDAKQEAGRDWFPLSGCKTGKIRVSAEWKPLDMAGSLHGSDQYKPPIGVVRLCLDKASDVKNVEATLGGKVGCYLSRLLCFYLTEYLCRVIRTSEYWFKTSLKVERRSSTII
jgi:Ca2+-dependent lipid-binding protein